MKCKLQSRLGMFVNQPMRGWLSKPYIFWNLQFIFIIFLPARAFCLWRPSMNWYLKSECMISSKIIILTKLQNYDYTNNKQKGLCSSSMKNYKMYRIFCLPSSFPIDCSFMQPSQENSCRTQNTPRVSIFKTRGGDFWELFSSNHTPTNHWSWQFPE